MSGRAGVSRWMSSVATICAVTPAVRSAGAYVVAVATSSNQAEA
jgi:hypothetical protein